jgi:DNA-binding NarL/FixJ family response regulator
MAYGAIFTLNRSRILIADDHIMFAESCPKLLGTEFTVVGIVGDGHALVREATRLMPDMVMVDIGMPGLDGWQAGFRVKDLLPTCKLMFLTMNTSPELVAEALRRGASGYVLKTCTSSELVIAVRNILKGTSFVSKGISMQDLEREPFRAKCEDDTPVHLSHKQRAVLQLLSEGKAMKEIAYLLRVSPRTIAFHKYSIMKMLGTKSNAELIRYAINNDFVAPNDSRRPTGVTSGRVTPIRIAQISMSPRVTQAKSKLRG